MPYYRMNNFMISERDLNYESDNLLNYYAGPIKINVDGFSKIIKLSTNEMWNDLLIECLEIAKIAWGLDESNNITINKSEILIEYNFKNINLFIEHNIIFL